MMDEHELEQTVRAGLERRAAETDVTAPVVDRARAAVIRRRRNRWSVVGAAAAVVLVVGGVALATEGGEDGAEDPPVVSEPSTEAPPVAVDGWRTEYWADIAVDIPDKWGYGGAPGAFGPRTVCAPGSPPGYVGRPITLTDVCTYLDSGWQPTAPYVWLGASVDPGIHEWDNGYVQETIEVEGATVTVGSDDAELRREILASARAGHEEVPCRTRYPHIPQATNLLIAGAEAAPYAWVCAYRQIDDAEDSFTLSYADEVDPRLAEQALAAEQAAPDQQTDCDYDPFEFVVLVHVNPGDTATYTVFETGCSGGTAHLPDGATKQMVDAGVEPWAGKRAYTGVRAVVSYFIGPMG